MKNVSMQLYMKIISNKHVDDKVMQERRKKFFSGVSTVGKFKGLA